MNCARLGWSTRRSGAISVLSVEDPPKTACFQKWTNQRFVLGGALPGLGAAQFAVWSKYSREGSEFMMDVPHAREQMCSAVGVRHRAGQSETPAPE